MSSLLNRLEEGDYRSLGQVPDVVKEVYTDNSLLPLLVKGLTNDNPKIAFRSAIALDKIGREKPLLLNLEKSEILAVAETTDDKNVIWHLSLLLSYLKLTDDEIATALNLIVEWLNRKDLAVFARVNSMQAIATISMQKKEFIPEAISIIEEEMHKGKAAINARGRILLKELKKPA